MTKTSTTVTTTEKTPEELDSLHHDCFACGIGNQHGLNLHFEVDQDGVATASWEPSGDFRSYPDRVHGGVIATLLDSAIVHALFAKGVAGVTAELTIRYLHRVNINDGIQVHAWIDSVRRGIYFCRAEVFQLGLLAVRCSAKFMSMPASTSAPG